MVVDPRASNWKIRLHLVGLSGENDLINPIPPIAVTHNTKTCLRTPMTPTNPLMGLFRVFPHLPWPPAPLVTLPRHPSDGCGVFPFAPPCLCTLADTSLSYIMIHFISFNAKADYDLSDLTERSSPPPWKHRSTRFLQYKITNVKFYIVETGHLLSNNKIPNIKIYIVEPTTPLDNQLECGLSHLNRKLFLSRPHKPEGLKEIALGKSTG